MKNKHILLFLVIGLVAAMLAACSRSASKGIATVTPKKTSFPGLKTLQTQQNMEARRAIATQTARSHQIVIRSMPPHPRPYHLRQPPAGCEYRQHSHISTDGCSSLGCAANYELKMDEFPYCIARRFNVNRKN